MESRILSLKDLELDEVQTLIGFRDENLNILSKAFHTPVTYRDDGLRVQLSPQDFERFAQVIEHTLAAIQQDHMLEKEELLRLIDQAKSDQLSYYRHDTQRPLLLSKRGAPIYPKTLNQKRLVDAFENKDIVFALGVAGTGKTYLAVAYAVKRLKEEKISKIVLTRPAVEAGESLGFLPGDMKEKVDPYLRPLYDALYDFLGAETTEKLIEKKVIEIAPLAFMRGRTLSDAVVILDEAQNTTRSQMKMFLTRMGRNCQLIVNGDITQTDLVRKDQSGLLQAWNLLAPIEEIARIELSSHDVMRHPLVQQILREYEKAEN